MPHLYFASPLFTEMERAFNAQVVADLRAQVPDLTVFLPQEQEDKRQEETSQAVPAKRQQAGRERLQTFYQEGIHICHTFYGMKREPGEECIFCQNLLDSFQRDNH